MRYVVIFSVIGILSVSLPVYAQAIVPDNTLGTLVNHSNNTTAITAGALRGTNLFHSFQKFSIPMGNAVTFDLLNTPTVKTIFSRVTGGEISTIDGLLQVKNGSNPTSLFLMNPNGIVVGPKASLDLTGSFIATTADRIQFKDGLDFTTQTPPALLSINLPIGLQMGQTPGTISVQGSGHLLRTQNPILAPYIPIGLTPGLRVTSGNTLALIGGNLVMDGGVLTAPGGRVELASIGSHGSVAILNNTANLVFGDVIGDRANIQLSNHALVDVNDLMSGSIQLQGNQIDLLTGALLWVQNQGLKPGGDITVNATAHIRANGTAPDFVSLTPNGLLFNSVSGIINETVGEGAGGKIRLNAPSITVQDGANMMTRSFNKGIGGEIQLKAQRLSIFGASAILGDIFSTISSYTAGPAKGGNVQVNVKDVNLLNGGVLTASTIGAGAGGNITINSDTIQVGGLSPKLVASSLSAPTIGGLGRAGNILLNTRTLTLKEGGFVVASSVGPGNAGDVIVNASESIEIVGLTQKNVNVYPSGIASAVSLPSDVYVRIFNLTAPPTGASGDVVVNTPRLTISNRGYVNVENSGSGMAGSLRLNIDHIALTQDSLLTAGSNSGQGGDIIIHGDTVQLRDLSRIYTSAKGTGNGGNIYITANTIVGIRNSDIIANAEAGNGGAIEINTQGLFGLKFRDRLTAENDITASSQFGINGTVQINTIAIDPSAALNKLPLDFSNASQQVASGCTANPDSRFVSTGRGGIPKDPSQRLNVFRTWEDLRASSPTAYPTAYLLTSPTAVMPTLAPATPMMEANHIQRSADGSIELLAVETPYTSPHTSPHTSPIAATCGG